MRSLQTDCASLVEITTFLVSLCNNCIQVFRVFVCTHLLWITWLLSEGVAMEEERLFAGFPYFSLSSSGFVLSWRLLGSRTSGMTSYQGLFFSFRVLEDSKRNLALGQPISVQQLSYSLSKRSTRLVSSRMFSLVVLENFSLFFVPRCLALNVFLPCLSCWSLLVEDIGRPSSRVLPTNGMFGFSGFLLNHL